MDSLLEKERRNILILSSLIFAFQFIEISENAEVSFFGLNLLLSNNKFFLYISSFTILAYMNIVFHLGVQKELKELNIEHRGKLLQTLKFKIVLKRKKGTNYEKYKNHGLSLANGVSRLSKWLNFELRFIFEDTAAGGLPPGSRLNKIGEIENVFLQFIRLLYALRQLTTKEWWYFRFPKTWSFISFLLLSYSFWFTA